MIVTITPNTAIDRTLFVPSFVLNRSIRAREAVTGMGGKAADASWILGELGIPSLALGFAGGESGRQMETMLQARGVRTDFTWVKGETRVNVLIVSEDGDGQSTIAVDSLQVSPADAAALLDRFLEILPTTSCLILGGSLPRGVDASFYTQLIEVARKSGVPVIFDASGPALAAGLSARPDLIKPNRSELEELLGKPLPDLADVYQAGLDILEKSGTSVVVSLGEQGALAILHGRSYRIPPLQIKVINTAGSGDGVLAGLAAAISRCESIEEGLRLGFAAASAVLLTSATADCRREDVERLLPQIQLIPYPE